MLIQESELNTYNSDAIIDEAVILDETESIIKLPAIPVVENSRLDCGLVHINDLDKDKFAEILKQNKIHKSTFKYSYYFGNDPIICNEEKYLVSPYYLDNANCYVESTLSANRAMYYALELIKEYGLLDKFKIEIE